MPICIHCRKKNIDTARELSNPQQLLGKMKTQKLNALLFLCWLLQCASVRAATSSSSSVIERDAWMTTPELINAYGYPVESHQVTTEDGYILTLHRIPQRSNMTIKGVVFLQHGVFCSSTDWVVMGPGKGLAYLLFDAGYDVWMGNARGNTYSKGHEKSLPVERYWRFSFHEMGVYDLPAEIDCILNMTGSQQLHYVGHSMGATMFFVMASERPEYNSKIRAMAGIGPVAYLSLARNPILHFISIFEPELAPVLWSLGFDETMPRTKLGTALSLSPLCSEWIVPLDYCLNLIAFLTGLDFTQINKTMMPVITAHMPAGTSLAVPQHYSQIRRYGKFQQMDWGVDENMARYGQRSPSEYNLSKITTPVALFTADSDSLVTPEDVDKLEASLKHVIGRFKVSYPKFDHLDFIWAIDAKSLVYDHVISLMDSW